MKIREANENDLDLLVESIANIARFAQESLNDPYLDDMDMDRDRSSRPWFQDAIVRSDQNVYLGDADGKIAGFIVGRLAKPFVNTKTIHTVGQINVCWVEPAFRGKGLSRSLVESIESWFREQGARYVEMNYLESNREAGKVWAHLGFQPYRIASRKAL